MGWCRSGWGLLSHSGWGLIWLVSVFLLIGLGIGSARTSRNRSRENADETDSLAILRKRLAAGAISESEYRRLREILTKP